MILYKLLLQINNKNLQINYLKLKLMFNNIVT
jgi:hypothetical protein